MMSLKPCKKNSCAVSMYCSSEKIDLSWDAGTVRQVGISKAGIESCSAPGARKTALLPLYSLFVSQRQQRTGFLRLLLRVRGEMAAECRRRGAARCRAARRRAARARARALHLCRAAPDGRVHRTLARG